MGSISLWDLQAHWQNHVFRALQKRVKVGASLVSTWMMFHREGTTMEQTLFLGIPRWTALGEGIRSIPCLPTLVGQV